MKKQSGAVLIVALIFLLLITAIAASLMTSGSFQTVIVANKQQRENFFHTAESALEQVVTNTAAFASADTAAAGTAFNADAALKALPAADSDKEYHVEIESLAGVAGGTRQRSGQSLGIGGGNYQMYEVRSTAKTTDPNNLVGTKLTLGIARYKGGAFGNTYDP